MINYLKIYYRLLVYLTRFNDLSGHIKKSSETDQSTGHFQSFCFHHRQLPYPKSEKKSPVNQLVKKSGLGKRL